MAWEPNADGHPGVPWYRGPGTAQPVCGGGAEMESCLLGAAQPRVHPNQEPVGRGDAMGKPPAAVLPPAREGALSQNLG